MHLGHFMDEREAALAYDCKATELKADRRAVLNFPPAGHCQPQPTSQYRGVSKGGDPMSASSMLADSGMLRMMPRSWDVENGAIDQDEDDDDEEQEDGLGAFDSESAEDAPEGCKVSVSDYMDSIYMNSSASAHQARGGGDPASAPVNAPSSPEPHLDFDVTNRF